MCENFYLKTNYILFNIVLKFTSLVVFQFLNIFCSLLTSYIYVFYDTLVDFRFCVIAVWLSSDQHLSMISSDLQKSIALLKVEVEAESIPLVF